MLLPPRPTTATIAAITTTTRRRNKHPLLQQQQQQQQQQHTPALVLLLLVLLLGLLGHQGTLAAARRFGPGCAPLGLALAAASSSSTRRVLVGISASGGGHCRTPVSGFVGIGRSGLGRRFPPTWLQGQQQQQPHQQLRQRRPFSTTTTTTSMVAAGAGSSSAGTEGGWREWHNPQDFGPPPTPTATGAGWVEEEEEKEGVGSSSSADKGVRNALVVLNTDCVGPLLRRFWDQAHLRVCADGGANRLYDAALANEAEAASGWVPHYVKGDLDSLRPEVARHFAKLGARVVQDPDQDTNDLEKCLELIRCGEGGGAGAGVAPKPPTALSRRTNVFVVGALGLRFDHAMAGVHILHRYDGAFRRLVLLGPESLAFLLPAGKHRIRVDPSLEGPVCGLLPLAGPCRAVTTRGLRWDLAGQGMAFGGLVSTSNEVVGVNDGEGVVVEIETSDSLVWTTTVRPEWRPASVAVD